PRVSGSHLRRAFAATVSMLALVAVSITSARAQSPATLTTLYTFNQFPGDAEGIRSEEHTSELQSRFDLVCRLLLEKKKQRITVREALRAYTAVNAYATFADKRRGTLAPGYDARVLVIDRNLFTLPPASICTARVAVTIVGGKVVYERR